jgi:hypothetical protein
MKDLCSVKENMLCITLRLPPAESSETADQNRHEFTYSLLPFARLGREPVVVHVMDTLPVSTLAYLIPPGLQESGQAMDHCMDPSTAITSIEKPRCTFQWKTSGVDLSLRPEMRIFLFPLDFTNLFQYKNIFQSIEVKFVTASWTLPSHSFKASKGVEDKAVLIS